MNILLAIDSSSASRKAAEFLGRVFGHRAPDDLQITVFHVIETLPEYLVYRRSGPEATEAHQKVAEEWEAANRQRADRLLGEHREGLIEAGIPEGALETKLVVKDSLPEAKKVVAALAIIEEMKHAPYDVVCLGRRGETAAESEFPGSVAEKVLRRGVGTTVWVVD